MPNLDSTWPAGVTMLTAATLLEQAHAAALQRRQRAQHFELAVRPQTMHMGCAFIAVCHVGLKLPFTLQGNPWRTLNC